MIQLPDIRQRADHDCGLAATRVVLRYWRRPKVTQLLAGLGTNHLDGTDPRAVEAVLRQAGLRVQSGEMTVADLLHHTEQGRPVTCLTQRAGVGHYVVVAGLKDGAVCYQDPAEGFCRSLRATWERCWQDVDRLGAVYRCWGIASWRG